jgi:sulfide:quinone oxidoreductase
VEHAWGYTDAIACVEAHLRWTKVESSAKQSERETMPRKSTDPPSEASPLRVLIAGGGVAGLETLMALRGLAGDLVRLTLIAPEEEFVYSPVTAERPFSVGRIRSVGLARAAHYAGAMFVPGRVEEVDREARTVTLSIGARVGYDALVLAVGADARPALEHVMTWDDRSHADMMGGLLQDVEDGYAKRLAVVIPPGPVWPLRGYELALLISQHAYDNSADLEVTIVEPDPPPLALAGDHAVQLVSEELERAHIMRLSANQVSLERGHQLALVLQPSRRTLRVDRVLALPKLRGRPIVGIPGDRDGLIEVDAHGRVSGIDRVWAVGDGTCFPLKSGGVSAEQADVAALDIAALAGAQVEPRVLDSDHVEQFAGLPAGRYLEQWLATAEPGTAMHLPTQGVPALTYLQKDLAAGWRGRG